MSQFNYCPQWAINILTNLCFNHIREQLQENLTTEQSNPQSFMLDGQLFVLVDNSFFLAHFIVKSKPMLLN